VYGLLSINAFSFKKHWFVVSELLYHFFFGSTEFRTLHLLASTLPLYLSYFIYFYRKEVKILQPRLLLLCCGMVGEYCQI
jgi:hypothetical protein